MTVLRVTGSYLLKLARNSDYNWMASLGPLRTALTRRSVPQYRGRACCGRGQVKKGTKVPASAFEQVVASSRFTRDLTSLKKRKGYSKVNVNVAGKTLTL